MSVTSRHVKQSSFAFTYVYNICKNVNFLHLMVGSLTRCLAGMMFNKLFLKHENAPFYFLIAIAQ